MSLDRVRRALALLGWLLALAVVAVGLVAALEVWATVYPRSPHLARAARLPLVGPWVARVRARHVEGALPTEPPHPSWVWVLGDDGEGRPGATARVATGRVLPIEPPPRLPPGVWGELWLRAGEPLRAQPAESAATVVATTRVASVPVLEARGEWRRVSWQGHLGWVRTNATAGPPFGSAPEPVRPLPARPPSPARLALARELIGAGAHEGRVGPYPLLSDVAEPALLLQLDHAASGLERVYQERYGVTPIGAPREAVVLYRARATYEAYLARTGGLHAETGHVAEGVVALYREGRLPEDVRATLVHELTHLLNRRALGPALPPWLDEGLADDLGESAVDETGSIAPGSLSAPTLRAGSLYEVHGGEAARHVLREATGNGDLLPVARLLALDDAAFHAYEPRALVYSEASFLVRFLLAGEHAAAFRAFLAGVSKGGDPTGPALATALGVSLESLQGPLADWLASP